MTAHAHTRFTRLSLSLVALLLAVSAFRVFALTEGDYTYTTNSAGQATITDFNSSYSGELSITNTLGGGPVTTIGAWAFSDCKSLTSVAIPAGVTSIGKYTFYSCSSLTSLTIPDSVTSISNSAFGSCTSLTAINVSPANPEFASIDGVLFGKDLTNLIQCPGGFSGHYTMPDSVTSIGDHAFFSCTSLSAVAIPRSVTAIGLGAFGSCTSLTSIAIPDSVTSIGDRAFYNCTSLTSVLFTGNRPSISSSAFSDTPAATIYHLPNASGWDTPVNGLTPISWNPAFSPTAAPRFASGAFGFTLAGNPDIPVRVEATTNIATAVWTTVTNTTIPASGTLDFSDPASSSHPSRFYRVTFPQ